MSVSLSVDGPGDAELISAVRGGDVDAYGELFARHVEAARRLARQLAGAGDADDLVSDAFTKVLTVLQRGGGPDLAFRAYLLTAVRRLHVDRIRAGSRLRPVDDLAPFDPGLPFHDTAVEGFDNAAAARAFASLPERWQMVLWHTEVEQQKPADIAPLLGMSANSVSALAYRAREGLRQAFLSQHATDPDDVDCAWTRDHLGAYVRGGLSRRDSARVDDHLAACRACAAVYLELTEVNSGLAALIAPLLLGSAGASYLSTTGAGSSLLSTTVTAAKTWVAAHTSAAAMGGIVATAAAVVTVYGTSHLGVGHHAADLGSPPGLDRVPASAQPSTGSGDHQTPHHRTSTGSGPSSDRGGSPRSGRSTSPTTPPPVTGSTPPVVTPTSTPTEPTSVPTTGPTGADQEITFTSTPPTDPTFGSIYVVEAQGGSGPITFSVDSSTTHDACSLVAPATVRFDHAGTCVIAASAEGPDSRAGADSGTATQSIDVPQEAQTVTITSTAPTNARVAGTPYTVTADPGVTENPVTYTTDGGCSVSDGSVTFQHVGDCTVTAHQDGNNDYTDASDHQTFTVDQGSQTIAFSLPPTGTTGTTLPLTATSSSGLDVAYSVDPETTNAACSLVDASTVSFDHAGTCVIDGDQPGDADYQAADRVTQSVVVSEPVHAVMTVSATTVQLHGNGQVGVTATVTGLPEGSTATLVVSVPGNAQAVSADNGCIGAPDGEGQTFTCAVTTADVQEFGFTVTINKGRPVMTFELVPDPPLTLDPGSVTTFPLPLVDDASPFTRRSFRGRVQP